MCYDKATIELRKQVFRMARWIIIAVALLAGCSLEEPSGGPGASIEGQVARVVQVIDGDTIDVDIAGEEFRVRYVGVNTPERDQLCYAEAVRANRTLVDNQIITLVTDTSDTDQYGRLLRYVYVGETLINEALIRDGWAEVVRYPPDTRYYDRFRDLEDQAVQAGRGCHPTGIYDDGSATR
jgi:micrococcal nuclease